MEKLVYTEIPAFPEYGITIEGTVCHLHTDTIIDWYMRGNIPFVAIYGNEYAIPQLLALTHFGPCELGIGTLEPGVWYKSRYVTYVYSSLSRISDNEIRLDGVRFKLIPITEHYYISEYGVIFNLRENRFIRRKFPGNHYSCVHWTVTHL